MAFLFPTQGVMGAVPTGAVRTGSKGSSTRECTRSGGGKFGDKEQPFHLHPTNSSRLRQRYAEKGRMWIHSNYWGTTSNSQK